MRAVSALDRNIHCERVFKICALPDIWFDRVCAGMVLKVGFMRYRLRSTKPQSSQYRTAPILILGNGLVREDSISCR